MLLAAAAAAWQVAPLVVVEAGDPVLCGYLYSRPDGIELRVEKGVRNGAVFTAIDLRGAPRVRLETTSFDSDRDLSQVVSAPDRVRLEGDLEERDAGGLLFAELAVSGGTLRLAGQGSSAETGDPDSGPHHALPAPLPRGVTAMYLNCAGDLIRPDAPN